MARFGARTGVIRRDTAATGSQTAPRRVGRGVETAGFERLSNICGPNSYSRIRELKHVMDDLQGGLSSGTVSELELEVTDPTVPCVAATTDLGGRLYLEQFLPKDDGGYTEYYGIQAVDPDRLLESTAAHEGSDARFLCHEGDEGILEMVVTGNCPPKALADSGAVPRSVSAAGGVLRILAEVPPGYDGADVTARFLEEHPDADLVERREKPNFAPLVSVRKVARAFRERLTEHQREAVELAQRRGYYAWPREVTRGDLAEELGTDPATVGRRLRAAERTLARVVVGRGGPGWSASGAAPKP